MSDWTYLVITLADGVEERHQVVSSVPLHYGDRVPLSRDGIDSEFVVTAVDDPIVPDTLATILAIPLK